MERRNTIQREAILHAVREMHSHPCADEVYEQISMDHPNIGKATVYRNLNVLSKEGLLMKLSMPVGPDRFDSNPVRHFHVQCVRCHRVFDVDLKEIPDPVSLVQDDHGFQFLDFSMHFHGICKECQNKSEEE